MDANKTSAPGAQPSVPSLDKQLGEALLQAARDHRLLTLSRLLKRGADPNWANAEGNTSLICASKRGHLAVVMFLVRYGARIDQANEAGITPLMAAASSNSSSVLIELLLAGATPNHKEKTGCTALHLAAAKGHALSAAILLKNGLDPHTLEENKRTALQLAKQKKRKDVVKVIKAWNAQRGKAERKTLHDDIIREISCLVSRLRHRETFHYALDDNPPPSR